MNKNILINYQYDRKRGTDLLRNDISSPVDGNWIKASFAEVLPVISSREIVAVIQEKLAVVDLNGFSDRKVGRREIFFDLLVAELHCHSGIRRSNVVTVLWNSLTRDENWKRISAVVGTVDLANLHSVVDEIVLNAQQLHLILSSSNHFTTVVTACIFYFHRHALSTVHRSSDLKVKNTLLTIFKQHFSKIPLLIDVSI